MPNAGWIGRYFNSIDSVHMTSLVAQKYLQWIDEPDNDENWNGEHIGKWLETAVLCYKRTRAKPLKTLMTEVVDHLVKVQLSNGYIGSYKPGRRFYEIDSNARPGFAAQFQV